MKLGTLSPVLYCSILCLLVLSCSSRQTEPICQEGINLLPEYGHTKKCAKQLQYDVEFLHGVDTYFKNHKEGARYYASRGWEYFNKQDLATAMKRFNQAWLLDTLNADIYWGFGDILGKQHKYRESMHYFTKSININPNNATVWYCAGISLGQLYFQSKQVSTLDSTVNYLKHSLAIHPEANTYEQLTATYTYYTQKDSARKYLSITEQIDSNLISSELRQEVMGK